MRVKDRLKVYYVNFLKVYIEWEEEFGEVVVVIVEVFVMSVICSGEFSELELDLDDDDNGFLEIGGYVVK